LAEFVVRGNHDRACSGIMGGNEFLDLSFIARYAADWTRETLTKDNANWLSRLPRGPQRPLGRKVACVHGSPWHEGKYIRFPEDALIALRKIRSRIIFHGHTHLQEDGPHKGGQLLY
jgi:diadenosine tetraphosphatase ApaH/serine/threonine PP2A family protein phosphatase